MTFEALTGGGAPNLGEGQEDGTDLPAAASRVERAAHKPASQAPRAIAAQKLPDPPTPSEAALRQTQPAATRVPSGTQGDTPTQGTSLGGPAGVGAGIGPAGVGAGTGPAFGTANGTGVSSAGRGTGVGIGNDLAGLARGYLGQLESYLGRNHQYPLAARRARLQGVVEVEITIQPTGHITNVRIVRSSGHDILDEAAISRLRTLRAVPPPPPALHWKARTIKYPVVYRVG